MTKPQETKQVLFTPVDVDGVDDAEYFEQKTQEEIEFDKFRDEMRDSVEYAKYTVARQPTDSRGRVVGSKLMQMFECGIDDYTFSQLCGRIRDDYGTGIYKITARKANGHYAFQQTIGIEAPKVDGDIPRGLPGGELLDTFSDAMDRQQDRIEKLVERISGPRTGGDPFDQMTRMMAAMGAMMGSFGMTPQPQKTLVDQLTEWKMLRELFDGDAAGGGAEANIYSLLTESVKNFGPLLGAAIAAQTEKGVIPLAGPVQALPAPGIVNPSADEPGGAATPGELVAMKGQINFLVGQAKLGAKPGDVAAAIVPGIPENSLESIEAFLQKADALEICASINAEVSKYLPWFEQWREAMLQALGEILEDAPEDRNILDPGPAPAAADDTALTDDDAERKTGDADAGLQSGPAESAATSDGENNSNADGAPPGGGGNEGDA